MTMGIASDSSVAPREAVGAALDGRAGHEAVRAILTNPLGHGLGALLDLARPGGRTSSPHLLRSKYKPGRKLTGYYTVADGTGTARRHIAVTWGADGSVGLLLSPMDPAMPELARLADPIRLGRLVEELSGLVRPADRLVVTTVRYRPGQRHVLHARYPAGRGIYVKADRDASGARAVPVAQALRDLLLEESPTAHVAEPLGYSAAEQAALWWEAPGQALASLVTGEAGAADLVGVVARVGRAVRAIHETAAASRGSPASEIVGSHAVEAEAAGTLRAGEHIAALLPAVGTTYANVVADVVDRLDRLPTEAATFVHGDLKADNLLVDGGRLHLLDLDRAGWAEPALDLGKFLADLRWWSGSRQAAAQAEAAFRAGYGSCAAARWARAELVATLFEVKFAARRCAVHDPRWPRRVHEQVTRAANSLGSTRSR